VFENRGLAELANKNHQEAEKWLLKAINLGHLRSPKSATTPERLKASLAVAYCFQSKWSEADNLLYPMSDSRGKLDALALNCLHAVSIAFFMTSDDFEDAARTCKKALLGKKKLLGRSHNSYLLTVDLMVRICNAKGDSVETQGWRHFLPGDWPYDWSYAYMNSPLDYLNEHMENANESPLSRPGNPTTASFASEISSTYEVAYIEDELDTAGTESTS
jgi:hypothetical protein